MCGCLDELCSCLMVVLPENPILGLRLSVEMECCNELVRGVSHVGG